MKFFPIKSITGIETKFDGTDQDRGTLRRADGMLLAPERALSSGPTWQVALGLSALVTSMNTALTGAAGNKVHFATIADSTGNTWLIAWDRSTSTCRGFWSVTSGSAAPTFSGSGVVITATNSATYRDKTAALFWYGYWDGDRLLIGNGTDTNLVWKAGVLSTFTAAASSAADPSQASFDPCTTFIRGDNGILYGAGNVTHPLRVYASDPPTSLFPIITGLLTADRSFADLDSPNARDSQITALSPAADGVIAHCGRAGAVWVGDWNRSNDGFLLSQKPLANAAGAANPACVAFPEVGVDYLGTDLEIYMAIARPADSYGKKEARDPQTETWKSAGQWNRAMLRGTNAAAQPFLVDDTMNGRVWLGTPLALRNDPGLYCFDRKSHSVTGPFHYPRLSHMAPLLTQDLPGAAQPQANGSPFVVVGVSTAGALLYADLGKVGELALDAIGTVIGASYSAAAVQPSPTVGLACIGVYNSGASFARVDSAGNVDLLTDPWGDWVSNGTSVPGGITEWYNDAALAIVEFAPEDFGSAVDEKDFAEVRLQWRPNQRVYSGVWVRSGQQNDGQWIGTPYPDEEQNVPVIAKGTRLTTRLTLVVFNGAPATLPDLTIGYEEGGPR